MFLRQKPIAHLITGSLFKGEELKHYHLHLAWPFRTHSLGRFAVVGIPRLGHPGKPCAPAHDAAHPPHSPHRAAKRNHARQANTLLGRTGRPFCKPNPTTVGCARTPNSTASVPTSKTTLCKLASPPNRPLTLGQVPPHLRSDNVARTLLSAAPALLPAFLPPAPV